jgi:predicted transcriptional regulator
MKHGSVGTLLGRLESKGLVTREKAPVGKAFVYRPIHEPASIYRRVIGDLLRRVFDGNSVALVVSLFETQPPTDEEIEDLQRLVEKLRQERCSEGQGK